MPRKEKVGKVVSTKMDKTIVVEVEEKRPHPKYGKFIKRNIKFKAHDEENTCHEGDVVSITECRPLSRDKHWQLREVLQRAAEI